MDDERLFEFAADMSDFIGGAGGLWPTFLKYMNERGIDEDEVDSLSEEINKRAGRN